IKQFFALSQDSEINILSEFIDLIKSFDYHITFNGITFDIPFLNYRFKKHNIDYEIDKYKDIDILRLIKPYKEHLSLSDCKLKTLEKYLRIERDDTISGKESVELYKEFEKTQDIHLKEKILLHNYDDIYYLGHMFRIKDIIYDKLDSISLIINSLSHTLILSKCKTVKNTLLISFISNYSFIPEISIFNEDYTISTNDNILNLNINLKKAIDKSNNTILFYYLNSIIPIKVNSNFNNDNVVALCKYILHKNFN
ncbi:MAG: ribonuclease H-like domain-containing protein, partial [Paraclostridium sp.]